MDEEFWHRLPFTTRDQRSGQRRRRDGSLAEHPKQQKTPDDTYAGL